MLHRVILTATRVAPPYRDSPSVGAADEAHATPLKRRMARVSTAKWNALILPRQRRFLSPGFEGPGALRAGVRGWRKARRRESPESAPRAKTRTLSRYLTERDVA